MRPAQERSVVGVDGCRGGWVGVEIRGDRVRWRRGARLLDVLPTPDEVAAVGVDIPIGLVDRGWRTADLEGRRRLPGATSRLFLTPPRAVLELGPTAVNEVAQALSQQLTGQGVSRQALALGPRILEVDALLRAEPEWQRRVVECHPEISFAAMAGGSPLPSKKTGVGVGARLAALADGFPGADLAGWLALAPATVPVDDCLDALACGWSGSRWAAGTAETLPHPPERDAHGLLRTLVI